MGARQSVAQPPRQQQQQQRSQSSTINNGHAPQPGPSGLNVNTRIGSGSLVSRTSRSLSVPVASILNARQQGNQAESSDSENEGALSLSGLPNFEQIFSRRRNPRLTTTDGNSGSRYPASLPIFRFFDIKCPVCNKTVPSDEAECHLVMCLTRPRITYNEDVLKEEKGEECVICLEELVQGDTIARLPCLCIYHKTCIDSWFNVKNCCPEHPGDDD